MSHFTEAQLDEIGVYFGIKKAEATLPVRDGRVKFGDDIWHRSVNGPKSVTANNATGHWDNIASNPGEYSIGKPVVASEKKVIYRD